MVCNWCHSYKHDSILKPILNCVLIEYKFQEIKFCKSLNIDYFHTFVSDLDKNEIYMIVY